VQLAALSTLTFTVDSCRRGVDLKRGMMGRSVVLGERTAVLGKPRFL
jgi:hypothetical protein